MDFNAPLDEQAMSLLRKLGEVEDWAKNGDPRAKPYLDAGAVRVVDGQPQVNRDRFLECYATELVNEHMGVVDRIINVTRSVLERSNTPSHED